MQLDSEFVNPTTVVLGLFLLLVVNLVIYAVKVYVRKLPAYTARLKAKGVDLAEYYAKWSLFLLIAGLIVVDSLLFRVIGSYGALLLGVVGIKIHSQDLTLLLLVLASLVLGIAGYKTFRSVKRTGVNILNHPFLEPFHWLPEKINQRRQRLEDHPIPETFIAETVGKNWDEFKRLDPHLLDKT